MDTWRLHQSHGRKKKQKQKQKQAQNVCERGGTFFLDAHQNKTLFAFFARENGTKAVPNQ
jgi:hypothetical protein